MGKLKRVRQKLHVSAVKNIDINKKEEHNQAVSDRQSRSKGVLNLPVIFPTQGLFSGTDIDVNQLTKSLKNEENVDTQSTVTNKSGQLKKKVKRKARHELFIQKIDAIKLAKKKDNEAKKRAQIPVVGDLQPLAMALPDLSEILQKTDKKKPRAEKKVRPTMKSSDRQKAMLADVTRFQQLQKNSDLKVSPLSKIKERLAQRQEEDDMDQG
ncbi:ribosome biogenesis protein SLX9 homolog [Saccoglossus kowalevskii]|uniref:Protein FAM207A-like n=1 Tax=Saccoglossus kowalevskii TaxID=10224 RepID=A0ABM0GP92_SACKO|nr:PREDICTED: protein FAM207A-like [Saccoglossus kowalevskii]